MTGVRPDHPELLAARNNLAAAYRAVGRMPEAIALYEQTLKLCESRFGPEDPRTRITRGNLVDSYGAAGRHAEAEALYAEALRRHRAAEKPDSLLLAQDLARLGSARLRQAKWAEAEPVLRESLAIRSRAIPDDWRKFGAMSLLGEALIGLGRFPEAEALVVAGYKGLAAREASVPEPSRIELPEAADRVVRLYGAWGKAEEAEAWEARLRSAKLPADVFARP